MPSNEELAQILTPEQLRLVRDIAAQCGCICHYAETRHFRACCDAVYFRVDLYDAKQKAETHGI